MNDRNEQIFKIIARSSGPLRTKLSIWQSNHHRYKTMGRSVANYAAPTWSPQQKKRRQNTVQIARKATISIPRKNWSHSTNTTSYYQSNTIFGVLEKTITDIISNPQTDRTYSILSPTPNACHIKRCVKSSSTPTISQAEQNLLKERLQNSKLESTRHCRSTSTVSCQESQPSIFPISNRSMNFKSTPLIFISTKHHQTS